MQIYFDIIKAIKEESTNGEVKPTRVQFQSNLSYDNLIEYLEELEKIKMIIRNPLTVTEKGDTFVQDYERVNNHLNDLGLKISKDED